MAFKPLYCVFGRIVIPQKYVLMVMLHLSVFNLYLLRRVLRLVVVEVTPGTYSNATDSCPEYEYEEREKVKGPIVLTPQEQSMFLSAFYTGYIFGHLSGGLLADKVGPKHVLGGGLLTSALMIFLMPLTIEESFKGAVCIMAMLGIAQGHVYPSIISFIQAWAPYSERSFIGGIAISGGNLGVFFGNLCTGAIIKNLGWTVPFYTWGSCAVIWYIFYVFLVYSRPNSHPHMTGREMEEYELEEMGEGIRRKRDFAVPWCSLVTSGPLLALFCANFADTYTYVTLAVYLPKYMNFVLKLDFESNVLYSSMPYLGLCVTTVAFSWLADYLVNNRWLSLMAVRKCFTALGNIAPSVFTLGAVYMGCNRAGAITMYVIALCLKAPIYTGVYMNCTDLSRRYAGSIMGLVNGFASLGGILGPWVVEFFTPNKLLGEWQTVYLIIFAICFSTTVIFCVFGEAKRQPWDYAENETVVEEDGASIYTFTSVL